MAFDTTLRFLFGYVYAAGSATLAQAFILFGPFLALAFLTNAIAKYIGKTCMRVLKPTLFLILLGWLGTLVHELGHLLFALLFFRKVAAVKLFTTDPWDPAPGYVAFYRKGNILQEIGNFFIGIGPLILGTLTIYGTAWWLFGPEILARMDQTPLMGDSFSLRTVGLLVEKVFNSAGAVIAGVFTGSDHTPGMVLGFLYVTLSIGSSMTLSKPDIKIAKNGFFALLTLLLVFNLATFWAGNYAALALDWLSPFYNGFYGMMIFALIISTVLACLLFPISMLL